MALGTGDGHGRGVEQEKDEVGVSSDKLSIVRNSSTASVQNCEERRVWKEKDWIQKEGL